MSFKFFCDGDIDGVHAFTFMKIAQFEKLDIYFIIVIYALKVFDCLYLKESMFPF